MIGPYPRWHWMRPNFARTQGMLIPGHRYRVTRAFQDFDKDLHAVGETWTYLGCNFLPYEDGLSLFVSLDGESEWHIRMQWRVEEQGAILEGLGDYLVEVSVG